jgi:hypothetical protein
VISVRGRVEPRWRRQSLATRVYVILAAGLAATIAVTVAFWSQRWVETWMPNFVAEWSGLLVAVAIVERLLEESRLRDERAKRAALRLVAGRGLRGTFEPLIRQMPGGGMTFESDRVEFPLSSAVERWASWLAESKDARDPERARELAEDCETTSAELRVFRADYLRVLEDEEVVDLDNSRDALARARRELTTWGGIHGWDIETGTTTPPGAVATAIGEAVAALAPSLAAIERVYTALAGTEFVVALPGGVGDSNWQARS